MCICSSNEYKIVSFSHSNFIISFQNTKKAKGQVKYLVYCMENAILNLPPGQDQMVWLIDFAGFGMSHLSLHVTKLTADVLQGHYPERLGVAILYNAPRVFESFWKVWLVQFMIVFFYVFNKSETYGLCAFM